MNHTQTLLGPEAIGGIETAHRFAEGDITQAEVAEFLEALYGYEFYEAIGDELGPCAAGGTFTLVIADALTTGRFRPNGENATDHAENMYDWLVENKSDEESRKIIPRVCIDGRPAPVGYHNDSVVGGHDDVHGKDGCGAMKKLGDILLYIGHRGDVLRKLVADRGIEISDIDHRDLAEKSLELLATGYVTSGADLRDAFVKKGGKDAVATVEGEHTEVAGVENREHGKTLNRRKLEERFGNKYRAFNLDVDPLPAATGIVSITADEAKLKLVGALYFNFAAELVLAGPTLNTLIRP